MAQRGQGGNMPDALACLLTTSLTLTPSLHHSLPPHPFSPHHPPCPCPPPCHDSNVITCIMPSTSTQYSGGQWHNDNASSQLSTSTQYTHSTPPLLTCLSSHHFPPCPLSPLSTSRLCHPLLPPHPYPPPHHNNSMMTRTAV